MFNLTLQLHNDLSFSVHFLVDVFYYALDAISLVLLLLVTVAERHNKSQSNDTRGNSNHNRRGVRSLSGLRVVFLIEETFSDEGLSVCAHNSRLVVSAPANDEIGLSGSVLRQQIVEVQLN